MEAPHIIIPATSHPVTCCPEVWPICKLCLKSSDEQIAIDSDEGQRLEISFILDQHFHFIFRVTEAAGCVCRKCWLRVETFHQFYVDIEAKHKGDTEDAIDIFATTLDGCALDCDVKIEVEPIQPTNRRQNTRKRRPPDVPAVVGVAHSKAKRSKRIGKSQKKTIRNNIEEPTTSVNMMDDEDRTGPETNKQLTKAQINNPTDRFSDDALSEDDDDYDWKMQSKDTPSNAMSKEGRPLIPGNEKILFKEYSKVVITPEIFKQLQEQLLIRNFDVPIIDMEQMAKYMDMTCDRCQRPFQTLREHQQHCLDTHNRHAIWKCCNIPMDNQFLIADHLKFHENNDAYKCIACSKRFFLHRELRRHISRHHMPKEDRFKCYICSSVFKNGYQLSQHENQHRTLSCMICDKKVSPSSIIRHMLYVHTTSLEVICDICGKISCDSKTHERHYLIEHSGKHQRLQCDICQAWVKHRKQMSKHMSRHFQKPIACDICEKVLPNNYALSSHKSVHHVQKKYKCKYCSKEFKKPLLLQEHEAIHTGINLYSCNFCDKTFRFGSALYTHRKKSHPVELEELKLQPGTSTVRIN